MKLRVCWIGKNKDSSYQTLTNEYLKRISRYAAVEAQEFPTEVALLKYLEKTGPRASLVLLDSRGQQLSSEEFAGFLRRNQDGGTAQMSFVIGPASGSSEDLLRIAGTRLSFGKMTLAHELARVVLLEQVYRAYTILKGHPYHLGH